MPLAAALHGGEAPRKIPQRRGGLRMAKKTGAKKGGAKKGGKKR